MPGPVARPHQSVHLVHYPPDCGIHPVCAGHVPRWEDPVHDPRLAGTGGWWPVGHRSLRSAGGAGGHDGPTGRSGPVVTRHPVTAPAVTPGTTMDYQGTTVIGQRTPGARLSRASAVRRLQSSSSSSATYEAASADR